MEQEKIDAANNVYNQIPFSELLANPLMACIDAQRSASQSSIDFIKSVGMAEGTEELVNVSFYFQNGDQTVTLIVPLLAIVPIPFFSVDTLDISFNAMADFSETIEGTEELVGKYSRPVNQSSKYDYDYYSNLNVHLHASKDHIPAGMSLLLNILDTTIRADREQEDKSIVQLPVRHDLTLGPNDSVTLTVEEEVLQVVNEEALQAVNEEAAAASAGRSIIWGCSHPECIQVSTNGVVTGISPGKGKVYARHENGTQYAQWDVTVLGYPLGLSTDQERPDATGQPINPGTADGQPTNPGTANGQPTNQDPDKSSDQQPTPKRKTSSSSSSGSGRTSSSSGRNRFGNIVDNIVGGDLLMRNKSKASNKQAADVVEAVKRNAEGNLSGVVESLNSRK